MSLLNNIKGYLNFSKQTNFDAGKQPATSEEAARKSEYHGRFDKQEAQPTTSEEIARKVGYNGRVENRGSKPDNSEKIAKLNKGIEAIDKSIAKASDEEFNSKVGIRDRYVNKVKELGGKVTDNNDTKATEERSALHKKVEEELTPKKSETEEKLAKAEAVIDKERTNKANRFLAEKGGTKAKATEPEQEVKLANVNVKATSGTGIAWDPKKFTKSGTTRLGKTGNGKTINTYKDAEGNIWIRGYGGMAMIKDKDGVVNKRYESIAKHHVENESKGSPRNDIRKKNSDGTTSREVADSNSQKVQTAMKGNMGIDPNTGMRMYPSGTKLRH